MLVLYSLYSTTASTADRPGPIRPRGPAISMEGRPATGEDGDEDCLAELNESLHIIATIFPRILPEVFREMLHKFDGESRLPMVVEQLLSYQDSWVKGRWRTSVREAGANAEGRQNGHLLVAAEDEFRRASYKWAAKTMLYEEFKGLSRGAIKAVLAEENFFYTRARPTLQKLAAKSWRNSFNVFWSKWRKQDNSVSKDHYLLVWLRAQGEKPFAVPVLRKTGDAELDMELQRNVLIPLLDKTKRSQEANDWEIMMAMNGVEAKHAGAIYECECCFSDTTFEQMATCTTDGHIICFRCICHTVSESLFGQGWQRNIDHARGQIRCLAPMLGESCRGSIPQVVARRALLQSKGGTEIFAKLESQIAEEALFKACLPLVRCPFCLYAEIDELYFPPSTIRYKLNTGQPKAKLFLLLMILNFVPLLLLYVLLCRLPLFCKLPTITDIFSTSLARLSRSRYLSRRFQCQSPSCKLPSCLMCRKVWHDPHACHEKATLSLRTTVEGARTAALKRTCPRCGVGFIKDSGCNKLTCVCGYVMCYICRQAVGRGEGGEGYRHFCQHFRPAGGTCKECDKCDLYKNDNEEELVRKAGVWAEREWREKEGMMGVEGIGGCQEEVAKRIWWKREWTMQCLVDWWVDKVITC